MTSKSNNLEFLVRGYRHLQIHERIHNSSYKARILRIYTFGVPLLQILSGYSVIALFHEGNLFQTFIFFYFFWRRTSQFL